MHEAVTICDLQRKSGEHSDGEGTSAKKARVVWSVEMHQQFVNAVNTLGVDSASLSLRTLAWRLKPVTPSFFWRCPLLAYAHRASITDLEQMSAAASCVEAVPKRILDLMNVEGLTRENVASHLQVR